MSAFTDAQDTKLIQQENAREALIVQLQALDPTDVDMRRVFDGIAGIRGECLNPLSDNEKKQLYSFNAILNRVLSENWLPIGKQYLTDDEKTTVQNAVKYSQLILNFNVAGSGLTNADRLDVYNTLKELENALSGKPQGCVVDPRYNAYWVYQRLNNEAESTTADDTREDFAADDTREDFAADDDTGGEFFTEDGRFQGWG